MKNSINTERSYKSDFLCVISFNKYLTKVQKKKKNSLVQNIV